MNVSLEQFSARCGGLSTSNHEVMLSGLCHDSRQVQAGDLFVCLPGEHYRGEQFLSQAFARGASAALVHADFNDDVTQSRWPLIRVADTAEALRLFAHSRRQEFSGGCLAITGSAGKTTTKEILSEILRRSGASVLTSVGNQNTELGLWLTMSRLEQGIDYLVLEMGARHRGDIEILCRQAKPDLGLVTAIEAVHLETFADLDEIVRTKSELYDALAERSCAVLNADLSQAETMLGHIRCERLALYSSQPKTLASEHPLDRVRTEMMLPPAQWRVYLQSSPQAYQFSLSIGTETIDFQHHIPGAHNLSNLIGAITAAASLGLEPAVIAQACQYARLPKRRLEHIDLAWDNLLIDDSYNANPTALSHGIEYASKQRQHLWVIVGELAELGPDEDAILQQLAHQLATMDFDRLICVGAQAHRLSEFCAEKAMCFADREQTLDWLLQQRPHNTCLYVKASRSAALEQLVDAYLENSPPCSTN